MQILTKDTSQKISTWYIQHCCHVVKRIMVNETNKGYTRQIRFNIYYNVVNYPETAPFFHFYYCLSEQSPVFYNMYQYTSSIHICFCLTGLSKYKSTDLLNTLIDVTSNLICLEVLRKT